METDLVLVHTGHGVVVRGAAGYRHTPAHSERQEKPRRDMRKTFPIK
ncbi:uncharacterized, partial [Tachysurus ichikawai]